MTKYILSQTDEDGNVLQETTPITKEQVLESLEEWMDWIDDNDGQLIIQRSVS